MIPGHDHKAPAPLPPRAERRIALSLGALWAERLWDASWPASGVALGYIALSLFDVWRPVFPLVHLTALAAAIGAIVYLLARSLKALPVPRRAEAIARLEAASALRDRPLETLSDTLAEGTHDPVTRALWAGAQSRAAAALDKLKTATPRSNLALRDPMALRFGALLLIVLGAWISGPDGWGRIASGLRPNFERGAGQPVALDAWIDPPPYTGLAPVFLARGILQPADDNITVVPEGAMLTMRLHGGFSKARLEIKPAGRSHRKAALLKLAREASGTLAGSAALDATSEIVLRAGGRVLGRWPVNVLPDQPPQISFDGDIKSTAQASMRIPYKAFDDFGLKSVGLRIALADKPEGEVLTFPLSVPSGKYSAQKPARMRAYKDLSAHPWAGANVTMTLVATDASGKQGLSEAVTMRLPERSFNHPLARALVDARRRLALADNGIDFAAQFLKAATGPLAPQIPFSSVFLALRTAYWQLADNPQADDIASASDLMWNAALALEQGVSGEAQRDLQAARDALAKALKDKAPQEDIAQKLQALREALNRYLDEMAQQMARQAPPDPNAPRDPNVQEISPEDLQNLLDTLENLAQTGANEQAEQLLGALDEILQNLQPPTAGGEPSPQDQARQQAMNDLGEIIGDQRKLMDETHRQGAPGSEAMPPPRERDEQGNAEGPAEDPSGQKGPKDQAADQATPGDRGPQAGGRSDGSTPQDGASGNSRESLAERQENLRERLGGTMNKLGEGAGDIPQALGRAERAMKDAQKALKDGNQRAAVESQKEALDALRDGAQSIAKAMDDAQRQASRGAGRGRSGRGTDPFGRPLAGTPDLNSTVEVPDKGEIQRAREILNEIRRRAAERGRPQSELDYLDRLLERF